MNDFTLAAYRKYLKAIDDNGTPFILFRDFIPMSSKPDKFCLIRHDVDRRPKSALRMAQLEAEMGVVATYYFRTKQHTFDKAVIAQIASLGHEIGYHYESLSDTRGNLCNALNDFKNNLIMLRREVDVKTCSMHGRPLLPFDNRDLLRAGGNLATLKSEMNLVGEVYLDIDYTNIAYINDTGRNWTSGEGNRRDKVDSKVVTNFRNGKQLLWALSNNLYPKICFQVHPERWTDDVSRWVAQLIIDKSVNTLKYILR